MLKHPVNGQPVFSSSATQYHKLGARGEDNYGRTYRYAQAGVSDLVVGNALQSAIPVTNHLPAATSVAAAAIGATSLTITPGATAGAAELYSEGLAIIDTTPGLGYSYPIKQHNAITSSTAFTVNLQPGWSIVVALTASSDVTLTHNPYKNLIQAATTPTAACVGVCLYIITGTEYGWVGTGGPHGTLVQSTPAIGEAVMVSGTTAGAVTDYAVGNNVAPVGVMMVVGLNGKVQPVHWRIN